MDTSPTGVQNRAYQTQTGLVPAGQANGHSTAPQSQAAYVANGYCSYGNPNTTFSNDITSMFLATNQTSSYKVSIFLIR